MNGTRSSWGWRPPKAEGIWRHGCSWTKPLFAAVPWVTLALLFVLFSMIADRLPQAPGLLCDLPPARAGQAVATGLAALVLPGAADETFVFFDDARYSLSDETSAASFKEHLAVRASMEPSGTFLLLADRRVPSGEVMQIAGIARETGVLRVQIAERRK